MSEEKTFTIGPKFVFGMPKIGLEFMLHAITENIDGFNACIEAGWRKLAASRYCQNEFLVDLAKIEDPALAKQVFRKYFSDASREEIQDSLFRKSSGDDPPIRSWFTKFRYGVPSTSRTDLLREARSAGVDFEAEFPFVVRGQSSAKHTLFSSFVLSASPFHDEKVGRDEFFPFLAKGEGKFVKEMIDLGVKADRLTMIHLLKLEDGKANLVNEWLAVFDRAGLLNATEILKTVSRMKIPQSNLAYLQSKAAMEAVEAVMGQAPNAPSNQP